jgi:hypothetical protein
MALKPIDPGANASSQDRKLFQSAQEQAKREPHLWANGPEHRLSTHAAPDPRTAFSNGAVPHAAGASK